MELFSSLWITTLLGILAIDSLLIGNNALLVGIALRKLPENKRMSAAFIVAAIATVFSVAMASSAGWAVANIPYFLAFAGLALVGVGAHTAYANWKETHGGAAETLTEAATDAVIGVVAAEAAVVSVSAAVRAALVGNSVASIENATVIGMLSNGSMSLIVAAVMISMLLVAFGSQLFIKLMAKYPRIPFFGGIGLAGLGVYFTVKALV